VLQQQTKALQEERPETGAEVSKRLESVKHLLWHGNTEEALERLGDLLMELSFIEARSNAAKNLSTYADCLTPDFLTLSMYKICVAGHDEEVGQKSLRGFC
jgi:hypothetical protein